MSHSISVVIPVKDRIDLLAECLDSVFKQTVQPLEVIVVDDGSTPPVATGLKDRSVSSPNLRIVRLETSHGANHARNVGVSLAIGDFVAFQDSDDLWKPLKLEYQLRAAITARVDHAFVYCPVERRLADGRVFQFPPNGFLPAGADVVDQLRRGNFISTQTTMVSRALLLKHKFDESLPRLQDWEAWIRMTTDADFVGIEPALAVSRETEVSISTDPTLYAAALPRIIKAHLSYFRRDREALAHWSRAALALSLRKGRALEAVRWAWVMVFADFNSRRSLLRGRLPRIDEHGSVPPGRKLPSMSLEGH